MKVLIIVAMNAELEGFLNQDTFVSKQIQGFTVYYVQKESLEIYLAKCEVGKVNSAILTTALLFKIKPRFVINAGIAGALNENIPLLSLVASTKISYHDFDLTAFGMKKGQLDNGDLFFKGAKKLLDLCGENVYKGLIVSGDQFMSTKEQLKQVKIDFPKALACDMEGCSIAHVASYLKRKFLVIRCISDNIYLDNQVSVYVDHKAEAIKKVSQFTMDLLSKLQN